MIHLDTHVLVWLYEGRRDLFPDAVAALIEENDLVISPMVELELEYLYEVGRAGVRAEVVVEDLRARLGVERSVAPFVSIVEHARHLSWTRDPFDRLIVATALADSVSLLTRDSTILDHCASALWPGGDEAARGKAGRRKRSTRRKKR